MFNLSKIDNIIYYNNPNVCSKYVYEKINPDHIGIIWGRRKDKSHNWIKICKVTLSNCMFYLGGIFERGFIYLNHIINDVGILHFCFVLCMAVLFWAFLLYIPTGAVKCGLKV